MQKQTWYTPAGTYSRLCADILQQPHALIAGATGSGKSVLINSIMATALYSAPSERGFVLIDPKRVELVQYKRLPHTRIYASEKADIRAAILRTVATMEDRYKVMQREGLRRYTGTEFYVVVDEFADLITTDKKAVLPALCRLAQLGRAAGIHLILATQRPTRDIVTGQIKVNIDARVALRCPSAQDSRNILGQSGAELLPRYGEGLYLTPDTMQPVQVEIPLTPADELNRLCAWWEAQTGRRSRKRERAVQSMGLTKNALCDNIKNRKGKGERTMNIWDLTITATGIRAMNYGYHERVADLSIDRERNFKRVWKYRMDADEYARNKEAFNAWLVRQSKAASECRLYTRDKLLSEIMKRASVPADQAEAYLFDILQDGEGGDVQPDGRAKAWFFPPSRDEAALGIWKITEYSMPVYDEDGEIEEYVNPLYEIN